MTKTYDPKKNIIVFGGKEIHGFAEDSIVEIEPKGDGITSVTGCDGEVTRNIDPNRQYTVTLKLKQSSDDNDYLSNLHDLDRATGRGMRPLAIKDLTGSTRFFAKEAWVTKHPTVSKEKESGTNEWVLETGPVDDYIVGGNN
ncbi:phage structural protein [Anaerosolibacter sp.]|uniref:phage structural protein n=1 Tax=Anaerosolibacter sp. TaxID=1872527 RepID=UPI0039EDFF4A